MSISKELLSEVLEEAVISIEAIGINGIHICSNRDLLHTECTLNIHELAYMCKEWAWKIGFYYWYENNRLYINTGRISNGWF